MPWVPIFSWVGPILRSLPSHSGATKRRKSNPEFGDRLWCVQVVAPPHRMRDIQLVATGVFKSRRVAGLTEVLGKRRLQRLRQQTIQLAVLCQGRFTPKPDRSLAKVKTSEVIIEALRNHFTTAIIVDTPPIDAVIDAAIIAQRCDGSLVVTASGAGSRLFKRAGQRTTEHAHPFCGEWVPTKFLIFTRKYGSYGNTGTMATWRKDKNIDRLWQKGRYPIMAFVQSLPVLVVAICLVFVIKGLKST